MLVKTQTAYKDSQVLKIMTWKKISHVNNLLI